MQRTLRRQIKDYIKGLLRPENLISRPEVAEKPLGKNILVFSPHFDDDVLGCGGTLYKHSLYGDKVTILYFTDGREGDPSIYDKTLVENIRKEEAKKATSLLGIKDLLFLDQPETKLKPTPALIKNVADIVSNIKPDLIYIPSFIDNHIDHFEVNRIVLSLSKEIGLNCNVCAYELWTPLLPNIIVDISQVISKKKEAAEQYHSQIKQLDYVNTMLALNRYRSITVLKGTGYAEAFLYTTSMEYIDLLQHLHLNRRFFWTRNY